MFVSNHVKECQFILGKHNKNTMWPLKNSPLGQLKYQKNSRWNSHLFKRTNAPWHLLCADRTLDLRTPGRVGSMVWKLRLWNATSLTPKALFPSSYQGRHHLPRPPVPLGDEHTRAIGALSVIPNTISQFLVSVPSATPGHHLWHPQAKDMGFNCVRPTLVIQVSGRSYSNSDADSFLNLQSFPKSIQYRPTIYPQIDLVFHIVSGWMFQSIFLTS